MHAQPDPKALAEQLTDATRSGRLSAAYAVLKAIPEPLLLTVSLDCGFSATVVKKRGDVMAFLLPQVVKATRAQTDGYGLQKIAKAACRRPGPLRGLNPKT